VDYESASPGFANRVAVDGGFVCVAL
jgi:hypothetical protein